MIGFAWFALFSWPVAAAIIFKKTRLPVAICLTCFGGYMLLPSGLWLDLPGLPQLDRESVSVLSALVLTVLVLAQQNQTVDVLPGWLPRDRVIQFLLVLLLVNLVGNIITNRDPLVYGPKVLPALRPYDAVSGFVATFLTIAPLLLGRRVLASRDGQRVLLVTLAISALVYSLPALYEVRMSPQLHINIYGYFPHEFVQAMRSGGFRPVVFMGHGLAVAIYWTFAMIALVGLYRANPDDPNRQLWGLGVVWLVMLLILSKSLGAIIIALILVPVAFLCAPRIQVMVAAGFAVIILMYPMLRAAGIIPIDQIMAFVERLSPDRAWSLGTRIYNEEKLLEKASERSLFGWGSWGRNRIYDEFGRNRTVVDGAWIANISQGGWTRYIGLFGLLSWPVIGLFLKQRKTIDPVCAALVLILCGKLIDLLPNAGMSWPYIWLIVGSLIGRLEMRADVTTPTEAVAEVPDKLGYARDPGAWKAPKAASASGYARGLETPGKARASNTSSPVKKEPSQHAPYKRAKPGSGYRR